MRKILSVVSIAVAAVVSFVACQQKKEGQWSKEKAWEWFSQHEWPVGCNYVPSYAINQYEFWQPETFNTQVIDREMALAEDLGFNTLRIYLHETLWFADKEGFKSRINQFLDLAESHNIKLIVTFFTNGGNHNKEFSLGPQPEAIPGVHNSNWVPSPGRAVIDDPTRWPALKEYVQDILSTYKHDKRILYWNLCNEPENFKNGCDVKDFMPAVYEWAWEVRPDQPLSSPIWQRPGINATQTKLDIVAFACTYSDIVTFHCYSKPKEGTSSYVIISLPSFSTTLPIWSFETTGISVRRLSSRMSLQKSASREAAFGLSLRMNAALSAVSLTSNVRFGVTSLF